MFEVLCSDNSSHYAIVENLPRRLHVDPNECEYVVIRKPYLQAYVGSAVHKNYKYKRVLIKALVKFFSEYKYLF